MTTQIFLPTNQISCKSSQIPIAAPEVCSRVSVIYFETTEIQFVQIESLDVLHEICFAAKQIWFVANEICFAAALANPLTPQVLRGVIPNLVCDKLNLVCGKADFGRHEPGLVCHKADLDSHETDFRRRTPDLL